MVPPSEEVLAERIQNLDRTLQQFMVELGRRLDEVQSRMVTVDVFSAKLEALTGRVVVLEESRRQFNTVLISNLVFPLLTGIIITALFVTGAFH